MDYPKANHYGQPLMPHPVTGVEQAWVRATTVAKALGDMGGLVNWMGTVVAAGAYLRPDLAGQVGAMWPMTDANKSEIYGLVEDLKDAGGGSVGRNAGDVLHKMFHRINLGEDFKPMPPWDADVKAERDLLARAAITIDPRYVERTVCLPEYGIAGSFDFLAHQLSWGEELLIADYKTGKLADYSWAEWVTQLAIYANASHIYDWDSGTFTPMPPVSKKRALVVSVPAGTGTAELYVVDVEPGMRAIKAALWVREWRKEAKKLARKAKLNGKGN